MRIAIALSEDGARGYNVLPGGQSGYTDSPFYSDQAALWLGNEAFPLRFDVEDVIEHAAGRELLWPVRD